MGRPANIRNVTVIAQPGHGRSTVTDLLSSAAGIVPAQEARVAVKSASVPMYLNMSDENASAIKQQKDGLEFLINVVDSPVHIDHCPDVTAALHITDGALLIIDVSKGLCNQAANVLGRALVHRVKPVLFLNKMDVMLRSSKEDIYQSLANSIDSVNAALAAYNSDNLIGDARVYPEQANVAFGSALQGWAFTLRSFAAYYSKKFGIDKQKMMSRLWGNNYFDPKSKRWIVDPHVVDGQRPERAFNMFILDPIIKLSEALANGKKDKIGTFLEKYEIKLTPFEQNLEGEPLFKVVMRKFLPAGNSILEMVAIHLPSPTTAQQYRVNPLYDGPMDDESAIGIRDCDSNGPLVFYVSRMVPTANPNRLYAFGRVFSGTVRSGQKARIQGPNFKAGSKEDLATKSIEQVIAMLDRFGQPIDDCPAGNIVGLYFDRFLLKSGTVTTSESAHNFNVIKYTVSPVVQVAVDVQHPADLPKLIEGLKRLSVSDPCIRTLVTDSGEHMVGGSNELHLEVCLKELEKDYAKVPLKKSAPVVEYRETVQARSSAPALSISQNRSNRLRVEALQLSEDVTEAIKAGRLGSGNDLKTRARLLVDQYDWEDADARKIWCFGPGDDGPNVLVDRTKGVQYLSELKDSCVNAFQWAAKNGVCSEEKIHGVQINVMDATLHSDVTQRGGGQIVPACRRVIQAACLLATPGLKEPIYLLEVWCPEDRVSGAHGVLNRRRGKVISEEQRPGTYLFRVKGYVPVSESFGLYEDLSIHCGSAACIHVAFDHWELMDGSLLDRGSKVEEIVKAIRVRKGLKPDIPSVEYYCDKY
ncbi:Elongation factor Tu GTP binding domain [Ceratobasidium sp. AG-Ba]|nr:Elongation factor Tu GTP binding domain [Ceratobasidium sp. AG-Ba]QRW13785.1 Elongation factor Tu GTP binding domain [Ceratobasidium sp. AG-Ba]